MEGEFSTIHPPLHDFVRRVEIKGVMNIRRETSQCTFIFENSKPFKVLVPTRLKELQKNEN